MDYIYFLGLLTGVLLAILIIIIIALSLIVAISIKTRHPLFPNLMITLITALEGPLKAVLNFFGVDGNSVTQLEIEIKNKIDETRYATTPYNERMLLLPQCLRHSTNCPAKLHSEHGIQCIKCGLCKCKEILEKAEELGYKKVVIAPGGTFAGRMMRKYKPKAVLGVGCLYEVQEGLRLCMRYKLPARGVMLSKDGCVNTTMDFDKLYEAMELKK